MENVTNKMKQTLPQIGVLLFFWVIGELIVWLFEWAMPGSIIGMILLTLALEYKVIKLSSVEAASDFFIRNMAFFFVPPGVGLMVNLNLIASNWLAITVATVISFVLVLVITGAVAQLGKKKKDKV